MRGSWILSLFYFQRGKIKETKWDFFGFSRYQHNNVNFTWLTSSILIKNPDVFKLARFVPLCLFFFCSCKPDNPKRFSKFKLSWKAKIFSLTVYEGFFSRWLENSHSDKRIFNRPGRKNSIVGKMIILLTDLTGGQQKRTWKALSNKGKERRLFLLKKKKKELIERLSNFRENSCYPNKVKIQFGHPFSLLWRLDKEFLSFFLFVLFWPGSNIYVTEEKSLSLSEKSPPRKED